MLVDNIAFQEYAYLTLGVVGYALFGYVAPFRIYRWAEKKGAFTAILGGALGFSLIVAYHVALTLLMLRAALNPLYPECQNLPSGEPLPTQCDESGFVILGMMIIPVLFGAVALFFFIVRILLYHDKHR